MTLNPFHGTGFFRCPLKPSGNLWFSDVLHSGSIEKCQCHEMGYNYVSRMLIFMLVP